MVGKERAGGGGIVRRDSPPPLPPEFDNVRVIPSVREEDAKDASLRIDSVVARVSSRVNSLSSLPTGSWCCLKVVRCRGDVERMWLAANRGPGSVPPHPAIARFLGCAVCREVAIHRTMNILIRSMSIQCPAIIAPLPSISGLTKSWTVSCFVDAEHFHCIAPASPTKPNCPRHFHRTP